MSRRLSFGMRVIACDATDSNGHPTHHDCSKDNHFESRIVGWDDYHYAPVILTSFDSKSKYWEPKCPWSKKYLRAAEGDDWTTFSSFKRNDEAVAFIHHGWSIALNRYFPVVLQEPYFNAGDWLVKFNITPHVVMYALVNEKDFK